MQKHKQKKKEDEGEEPTKPGEMAVDKPDDAAAAKKDDGAMEVDGKAAEPADAQEPVCAGLYPTIWET